MAREQYSVIPAAQAAVFEKYGYNLPDPVQGLVTISAYELGAAQDFLIDYDDANPGVITDGEWDLAYQDLYTRTWSVEAAMWSPWVR